MTEPIDYFFGNIESQRPQCSIGADLLSGHSDVEWVGNDLMLIDVVFEMDQGLVVSA